MAAFEIRCEGEPSASRVILLRSRLPRPGDLAVDGRLAFLVDRVDADGDLPVAWIVKLGRAERFAHEVTLR